MPKTFVEELQELRAQIHFKENSIPSIHAGKLTDESIQVILKLVEERIIGEDETVDDPPCCDGECGGMTFDEYDHENAATIARNRSRDEQRQHLYEGVEE